MIYLLVDFSYKPITLQPGTPKFEKVLEATGKALNKWKNKAETAGLYDSLQKARIQRGLSPIETTANELRFIGQKTRFDNMKPVDLNTTKARKILPYKSKEDGFVDSVSPIAVMRKPSKQNEYLDKAISVSKLRNELLDKKIDYQTQQINNMLKKR